MVRYNKLCAYEDCGGGGWSRRFCREDNVVCVKCYQRLPINLRNGLWERLNDAEGDHQGRITLALNWLDENPE